MKNAQKFIILVTLLILSVNLLHALPTNWNYNITYNSHVILVQPSTTLTIDGIQIVPGDFIGVFYANNSGSLSCGGYMEYQGIMNSINAWTEDLGDDGFQSGELLVWKIWDTSENMEYIAEVEYDITGAFPNQGLFFENGMSGLSSLTASSNIVPWNYSITGTNHSILIPESATMNINNTPISHGDYLGVFYDSVGTLACAGYVEWFGFTTSISVWGEDIGDDGFETNEEFIWKIWDKSENVELISQAYYMGFPMPNSNLFVVNGMSGIDSIRHTSTPWNYTITATNHTILIPETGTYLINTIPISIGDYIGVFYDSIGVLACAGYSVWEGANTSIAAWGEDLGDDGFVVGEEFKWKVWDVSDGLEYYASAIYMGTPLPNQGNFVINGMSGVDSLLIINNPPNWNYSITSSNHTILIPDFGDYNTTLGPIDAGDFIGVFYDSLGTEACGGYTQWFGLLTTIAAWGEDLGNDGFSSGEEFTWKIWDTSTGTEHDVIATYMTPPTMPNSDEFVANGMSGVLSLNVFEVTPPWDFTNTGSNHSILIPDNINILIDNNQIESGDYLGVFYDSLGTLACAGYIEYDGSTVALTAWGEDLGNDGFASGEVFNWMLWDASLDSIWMVYADYDITFPQQEFYTVNGISSLTGITTQLPTEIHNISLVQGWGIYSTYVDPYYPDMDSIFSDIITETIMCKNADGFIYWPAFSVNLIGDLTIGEGYLIKMNSTQTLTLTGDLIVPEVSGINLGSGWDMIAYLRKTPAAIAPIMDPIVTSIELIKDGDGNIFWPQFSVDFIGNMFPGKGYQVKMLYPETLYYPANTLNISKATGFDTPNIIGFTNTGSNMTLCIPEYVFQDFNSSLEITEILAYNENSNCVGISKLVNGLHILTLWGDDLYTDKKEGLSEGEKFILKSEAYELIEITEWEKGSQFYLDNKISIAQKAEIIKSEEDFSISEIFPNPCVIESEIIYTIPEDGSSEISIYNLLGEIIISKSQDNLSKGRNSFKLRRNNLAPGRYILKISFNDEIRSTIIDIL